MYYFFTYFVFVLHKMLQNFEARIQKRLYLKKNKKTQTNHEHLFSI